MYLLFNHFSFSYKSGSSSRLSLLHQCPYSRGAGVQCHQYHWGEGNLPVLPFAPHQGEGHLMASSAGSRGALTEECGSCGSFSALQRKLRQVWDKQRLQVE